MHLSQSWTKTKKKEAQTRATTIFCLLARARKQAETDVTHHMIMKQNQLCKRQKIAMQGR